jgi:CRP-like cAMP-binding protein
MYIELDPRTDPDYAQKQGVLNREVFYKGQTIIEQGAMGHRAFYIESGTVEIAVKEDNHTLTVSRLGPGEIFGEMALIENCPRTASVKAVEDTVVTEISQDVLDTKLKALGDKAIGALLHVFVNRLREANQGQLLHYRNLAEFQDRMAGISEKAAQTHLDQAKRERFRKEVVPLLDALEHMLQKYRQ